MPAHITNKNDVMEFFARVDKVEAQITLESVGWLLKGRGVAEFAPAEKPKRTRKAKAPIDAQQTPL